MGDVKAEMREQEGRGGAQDPGGPRGGAPPGGRGGAPGRGDAFGGRGDVRGDEGFGGGGGATAAGPPRGAPGRGDAFGGRGDVRGDAGFFGGGETATPPGRRTPPRGDDGFVGGPADSRPNSGASFGAAPVGVAPSPPGGASLGQAAARTSNGRRFTAQRTASSIVFG